MTLQDILFTVSIVFFVLAFILVATAVAVFFLRNIPDVRADLSGKKRAEAVARIDRNTARNRRRASAAKPASPEQASSGNVRKVEPAQAQTSDSGSGSGSGSGQPRTKTGQAQSQQRVSQTGSIHVVPAGQEPARRPDEAATTILPDDNESTTILPDDEESTTILRGDDSATAVLPVEEPQEGSAVQQAVPDSSTWEAPKPHIYFEVVRKIVLGEATSFVQPEKRPGDYVGG